MTCIIDSKEHKKAAGLWQAGYDPYDVTNKIPGHIKAGVGLWEQIQPYNNISWDYYGALTVLEEDKLLLL